LKNPLPRSLPKCARTSGHDTERAAERAAGGADQQALEHQRQRQFPARYTENTQQCELGAAAHDRQRARRKHQEGAGKQRNQRQNREIYAVGAGDVGASIRALGGCGHMHAGRQQRGKTGANLLDCNAGAHTQIDARQHPFASGQALRAGDVDHAQCNTDIAGIDAPGNFQRGQAARIERADPACRREREHVARCDIEFTQSGCVQEGAIGPQNVEILGIRRLRDQLWLNIGRTQRIDAQQAQRARLSGGNDFQCQYRACRGDAGVTRHAGENAFVEAAAPAFDAQVGAAGQDAHCLRHLRDCRSVDGMHGGGESHAERDAGDAEYGAPLVIAQRGDDERSQHHGSRGMRP
jgi:hypothetical protein